MPEQLYRCIIEINDKIHPHKVIIYELLFNRFYRQMVCGEKKESIILHILFGAKRTYKHRIISLEIIHDEF